MHQPAAPEHDLLCVGLSFVDVALAGLPPTGPVLGQELWTHQWAVGPGGVANYALTAARLGGCVALATVVGDDDLGRLFLARCRAEGIDCAPSVVAPGWAQPVTAALTWAGDRALVTGGTTPPVDVGARLVDEPPRARTAIVHLGERPTPWTGAFVHDGGRIVGQVGWDPTGRWELDALPGLGECWAFLPNECEALAYARCDDVRRAGRRLAERVGVVVITRGADGCLVFDAGSGGEVALDAWPARVCDATGAGDMFGAAFCVGVARGLDVADAADLATVVAGLGVERPGGASTAPGLADVMRALRSRPDWCGLAERVSAALAG